MTVQNVMEGGHNHLGQLGTWKSNSWPPMEAWVPKVCRERACRPIHGKNVSHVKDILKKLILAMVSW